MPFVVSAEADARLREWLRAKSTPQDLALRARIVLLGAEGVSIRDTAARLSTTAKTVKQWRARFRAKGVAGLLTAAVGRPKTITPVKERSIVAATMKPPANATHWSAVRLSRVVGVSPRTVLRIWNKYGLQPHQVETFKFSNDPDFDAKLADIVGLYLDPPERALVLSVDEKSQIQALDRTQPVLPMRPGVPARMTHDYKRNGTTSLFAALEVATGKVHGKCFARHTHVEFIGFLEHLAPSRDVSSASFATTTGRTSILRFESGSSDILASGFISLRPAPRG